MHEADAKQKQQQKQQQQQQQQQGATNDGEQKQTMEIAAAQAAQQLPSETDLVAQFDEIRTLAFHGWNGAVNCAKHALEIFTEVCRVYVDDDEEDEAEQKSNSTSAFVSQFWKQCESFGLWGVVNLSFCRIEQKTMLTNSNATTTLLAAMSSLFSKATVARLVRAVDRLRLRAIMCVGNVLSSAPSAHLKDDALVQTFGFACATCNLNKAKYEANDAHAIEEVGALLYMAWHSLGRVQNQAKIVPDMAALKCFVHLARNAKVDEICVSAVNCLALTGVLLQHAKNNFIIATVLFEVLHGALSIETKSNLNNKQQQAASERLQIANEAIGALIDLYSDETEHVDMIKKIKLVPQLEHALQLASKRAEACCKWLAQHDEIFLEQFQETLLNLSEFIKYKKSHA
jgi:hypothetical protein